MLYRYRHMMTLVLLALVLSTGNTVTHGLDAHEPVTIDTFIQQDYIKASNTDTTDFFGLSVAIDGDTMVIGAPFESSSATGINGDETDNSAIESGAVYIFVRSGTTWSQQAYLKASNTDAQDVFGFSVAISGDTVVVGATGEDSAATGINGDETNNNRASSGAAYVFTRSGTTWSQQAYLKASNTDAGDNFGRSVAISGDTIVVGAINEDSAATSINGDETDNSLIDGGAAYVFTRSGTTWSQQAYLKASNSGDFDNFGFSVAIDDETLIIGAHREASTATGVNGDGTNNDAAESGAAYVFTRSGTTWSQQAYLKASNTDAFDNFGISVAVDDNTAVIGAQLEDSNGTGVDGNQPNNDAANSGAAYVFTRSGTTWSQQAYLKASNTDASDFFGNTVAVAGNTLVIGAFFEASNATGSNGDQSNNSAADSGAAYIFNRDGTTWSQQTYLKAANTDPNDNFATAVAISGDQIFVGAPLEDSSATGISGDPDDNSIENSGAVYIYQDLPIDVNVPLNFTGTNVDEGDQSRTITYEIALETDPNGSVIIDITTDGQCELTTPAQLTFLDATPQRVRVIAIDDSQVEPSPHACVISHTVNVTQTEDPNYTLVNIEDVVIDVLDNDVMLTASRFEPVVNKIGTRQLAGAEGDVLVWDVTVFNAGDAAGTGVILTDVIRDELQVIRVGAADAGVATQGQTVVVTYDRIEPGEVINFSIVTTPGDGRARSIDNTVCLSADNAAEVCATGTVIQQLPQTGETPAWRTPIIITILGLSLSLLAGAWFIYYSR